MQEPIPVGGFWNHAAYQAFVSHLHFASALIIASLLSVFLAGLRVVFTASPLWTERNVCLPDGEERVRAA